MHLNIVALDNQPQILDEVIDTNDCSFLKIDLLDIAVETIDYAINNQRQMKTNR